MSPKTKTLKFLILDNVISTVEFGFFSLHLLFINLNALEIVKLSIFIFPTDGITTSPK